jgi:hypothetical protein
MGHGCELILISRVWTRPCLFRAGLLFDESEWKENQDQIEKHWWRLDAWNTAPNRRGKNISRTD